MENTYPKVSRTFDLLDGYRHQYAHKKVALAGKDSGKWKAYSAEEYIQNTNNISLGLLALGLKKGDIVATVTNNRPEWNFFDLGMAQVGIVHVPIYPTISFEEYEFIIKHAEASYLVVGDKKLYEKISPLLEIIPTLKGIYGFDQLSNVPHWTEIVKLGETYTEKDQLDEIKASISENDLATIIYTSGTTGTPKGVMLSHRNLVSNFTQHAQNHELGQEANVLSFLPLCHVYERSMNYHFQYKGMSIYYVASLGQIMNALKEVQPHMFNTVPRLLERIYDGIIHKGKELSGIKKWLFFWAIRLGDNFDYGKKFSLPFRIKRKIADKLIYSKWRAVMGGNVKIIVSGGAALQPRIGKVLGVASIYTLEGYGLTETSPVIAVSNLTTNEIRVGTVGPVLPGVDMKFADDGEIIYKGPNVMMGYYKEPELTKEAIDKNGYFHTGDIGKLVEGKFLKITDRKKEIFKLSSGKYISPQSIENKLKESVYIEQAMVIGENQKFASALIVPAFAYIAKVFEQMGIEIPSERSALIKHPELVKIFHDEVRAINVRLGQVEEIKRFRLVTDEWTPETGELSPTLKLKRKVLVERYHKLIEEIFDVS